MILRDAVWWNDFMTTLIITVVTVAIELVVGFIFAYVMLRIIRGRGPLRTAILIPLRNRHRRLGVHMALRVRAGLRLRQPVVRADRLQLVR